MPQAQLRKQQEHDLIDAVQKHTMNAGRKPRS